jgi:hypothetical protein
METDVSRSRGGPAHRPERARARFGRGGRVNARGRRQPGPGDHEPSDARCSCPAMQPCHRSIPQPAHQGRRGGGLAQQPASPGWHSDPHPPVPNRPQLSSTTCTPSTPPPGPGPASPPRTPPAARLPDTATASRRRGGGCTCTGARSRLNSKVEEGWNERHGEM